jgi:hypothetical protein
MASSSSRFQTSTRLKDADAGQDGRCRDGIDEMKGFTDQRDTDEECDDRWNVGHTRRGDCAQAIDDEVVGDIAGDDRAGVGGRPPSKIYPYKSTYYTVSRMIDNTSSVPLSDLITN